LLDRGSADEFEIRSALGTAWYAPLKRDAPIASTARRKWVASVDGPRPAQAAAARGWDWEGFVANMRARG